MRIREQPRQSRNRGSIRGYPGPQISALLGHRSGDGGPLHLPPVVHDNTGVVLEIDKLAVLSPKGLPLANDDGWHNLLPELWFTLLDCSQDHVATAGSRQPVEPAPDTVHSDHVEVLTPGVVCAVHDCSHWASQGDAELGSRGSSFFVFLVETGFCHIAQ